MSFEEFLSLISILFLFICALLVGCTKEADVQKYAKMEQWDSYKITGTCYLSCGKGDFFRTEFEAIKNNEKIQGCICSGLLFKGATLRIK